MQVFSINSVQILSWS